MTRKLWFAMLLVTLAVTAGCAGEAKMVKLETSMGDIVIELDEENAPVTVKKLPQLH